jgi:hypothetical protein
VGASRLYPALGRREAEREEQTVGLAAYSNNSKLNNFLVLFSLEIE